MIGVYGPHEGDCILLNGECQDNKNSHSYDCYDATKHFKISQGLEVCTHSKKFIRDEETKDACMSYDETACKEDLAHCVWNQGPPLIQENFICGDACTLRTFGLCGEYNEMSLEECNSECNKEP